MDEIETIVIGAGVVGLAVGKMLTEAGQQVIVLEAEPDFGSGISSRNSEVIHAGIYYPEDSLKASACVKGKELLYPYLKSRGVPHVNCGKFIVATHADQIDKLKEIKLRAEKANVFDLEWVDAAEIMRQEPNVVCVAGLWSPSTGIIDSHAYMQALLGDIEAHGGMLVCRTPVKSIRILDDGFEVDTAGEEGYSLKCRNLINSAGLGAQGVAAAMQGLDPFHVPPLHFARGNYFMLSGKPAFSRLIYPVPEPGGLGVHVTIDMGGQVRFGPDVEWIDSINYDLDAGRAQSFYKAIRAYYPGLADGALVPGYTGIRPKLKAKGEGDADFLISGPDAHGVKGLVNMFGIESPGLTASLALAEMVRDKLVA